MNLFGMPDVERGKEASKEIIEKELKALEIIKKHIRVEKDEYGLYWLCGAFGSTGISEEEYDLLKEVLL